MNFLSIKKGKLVGFSVLGIIAVVVVTAYCFKGFNRITTDDAYVEGRTYMVAAKVPGTVKAVNVKDNQFVKEGDILVEVDPADYELRVSEAQANLDIRKAAFKQASRDKKRTEALYKQEVYSRERYENTLTAYNLAKAQVNAAQAQLNIARRNLAYTKIYALSSGSVTKKSVEVGNQIQPGQALMAVVALDDIWVIANYKETQLRDVMPGQRVEIKLDTYPGKIFTGRVDSIMAGTGAVFSLFPPENALGNYVKVVQRIPVKIVFDKPADGRHVIRIGMSCVPAIITKDEQSQ